MSERTRHKRAAQTFQNIIQWGGGLPDQTPLLRAYLLMSGCLSKEAEVEILAAISPPIIRVEGETQ